MKTILFVTYVCLHVCFAQNEPETPKCIESGDDLEKICQYPKFIDEDELLRATEEEEHKCYCDFSVDEGYHIEIIVDSLKLDGAKQDYLLISSDDTEDKYKLSWHLNQEKRFLILGSSAKIEFKTSCKGCEEQFSVRMRRYGVLTTTTPKPTTSIEWPTPANNDRIFHTVYLQVTPSDVNKKNETFRSLMATVAQEYCKKYEIPLNKSVTKDNVIIDLAITCPMSWPDYQSCTQLRYAIPVFLVNATAYELKLVHLKKIWSIFVDTQLGKLDWTLYEVPDNESKLLIWVAVSLGVLIVFSLLLLAIRKVGFLLQNPIQRRLSDTKHIISSQSRVSDADLIPPKNQMVPPLFDNNTLAFFEPDMMAQSQTPSNNMIDIDESSDEEILTVPGPSSKHSSIILDDAHVQESMM